MFTPEQQLANVRLAIKLWEDRVKPSQVVPSLHRWVCGSKACFGGWLATWPEFNAMGVGRYPHTGAPYMKEGGNPSEELFGVRGLMSERMTGDIVGADEIEAVDAANLDATDYDVVLARLRYAERYIDLNIQIRRLEEKL